MDETNDPNSVTGDANDRSVSEPDDLVTPAAPTRNEPTAETPGTASNPEPGSTWSPYGSPSAEPGPATASYPPVGGFSPSSPDAFPTYSPYSNEYNEPIGASPMRRWLAAAIVASLLLAGGLGAGLGAAFSPNGSSPSTGATGGSVVAPNGSTISIAKIASSVEPAVVDINTKIASEQGEPTEEAAGTGMILTANGEILTNNHVVEQATSITVTIAGHSGNYPATVLGVDPTEDVALIKVQGFSNLPYINVGDSDSVAVGDSVVAIGNALGFGGSPSVANGIITSLNRTITASDETSTDNQETLHGLLQTSVGIQPGDSGGPLVDAKGQVIGMDTAAAAADGDGTTVGFAIPIKTALSVVAQIRDRHATADVILGASPFLGVIAEPQAAPSYSYGYFGAPTTTAPTTTAGGVQIGSVVTSGPAEKVGLAGGDSITSINGHAVNSWSSLTTQITALHVGETVPMTYVDASGTSHNVRVTLAGIPK